MIVKINYFVPVAAIVVLAAVTASACSSDDGDLGPRVQESELQVQQLQGQLEQLGRSLEKGQALAALNSLNATGFHAIDEEMQAASEIPAGILGRIRKARQSAEGMTWPAELEEQAGELVATLTDFENALSSNDLTNAKRLATASHDAFHNFEGLAYAYIAGEEAPDHDD